MDLNGILLKENRCRLGTKLKNIREERNLSQEKLAELMNVDRTTISKIESGKNNCSIDYLTKFSKCLNFEIEFIMKEEKE